MLFRIAAFLKLQRAARKRSKGALGVRQTSALAGWGGSSQRVWIGAAFSRQALAGDFYGGHDENRLISISPNKTLSMMA
jgi:hypothetical protein